MSTLPNLTRRCTICLNSTMMVCYSLKVRQPNMLMTDCGGLLYRYTNTDLQWESGSKLDARWGQCHSSYMTGSFLKILMKVLTPKNTYKIEFPISARQQFVYVYSLPDSNGGNLSLQTRLQTPGLPKPVSQTKCSPSNSLLMISLDQNHLFGTRFRWTGKFSSHQ